MFVELTLKISDCPSSKYKNQNVLNTDLNVPEFDLFRALSHSFREIFTDGQIVRVESTYFSTLIIFAQETLYVFIHFATILNATWPMVSHRDLRITPVKIRRV